MTEQGAGRPADESSFLTRQNLYDRVWQTPMSRLAPQLGLSDVGLAKVCQKHQVPRPPRGHWARLQHGKPTHQPPLPELQDGESDMITITPCPHWKTLASRVAGGEAPVLPGGLERVPTIKVPSRLVSPHPLVQRTLTTLRSTS